MAKTKKEDKIKKDEAVKLETVKEPEKTAEKEDFFELLIDLENPTNELTSLGVNDPEPNITGAPKNFMIRCHKCRWGRLSSGLDADMKDMQEINRGCRTCGKWRKFRCKRCGLPAAMVRIRGNK